MRSRERSVWYTGMYESAPMPWDPAQAMALSQLVWNVCSADLGARATYPPALAGPVLGADPAAESVVPGPVAVLAALVDAPLVVRLESGTRPLDVR